MTRWRSLVETLHIMALALWFGSIAGTGAAAAVVFPALKRLDVRVPGYESAPAENYRVAGGMVAQQLFLVGDLVMFACSFVAVCTFGVLVGIYALPLRRPATIVRALALAVALAALGSMLFIVSPSLNAASELHWAAMKAGDAGATALHRSAVDQLHPIATNLMALMAFAVLVALAAGVCSLVVAWSPTPIAAQSKYPEPALLKQRRS